MGENHSVSHQKSKTKYEKHAEKDLINKQDTEVTDGEEEDLGRVEGIAALSNSS